MNELDQALLDLAHAVTAASVLTGNPATSTSRGVVTSTTPLRARVGIATTATSVTNSLPGYTPAVGHVVVVTRSGRHQFITGKT